MKYNGPHRIGLAQREVARQRRAECYAVIAEWLHLHLFDGHGDAGDYVWCATMVVWILEG